jgi:type III secretion protein Q
MKPDMPTLLARPADAVTELGAAGALPRLPSEMAHALRELYSACAAMDVAVRNATVRFEWKPLERRARQLDSYRFRLGPHEGVVGIDLLAVAGLLGERRVDLLPPELRCVLWADALHPLTQAIEQSMRLHFEWLLPSDGRPDETRDERAAGFEVLLASGQRFNGFVQFDEEDALGKLLAASTLPRRPPARALDGLRLPLPFCLGSTQITLREVAGIRAGDILSIEAWGSAGSGVHVTADLAAVGLRLAGLAEGSRITIQEIKDHAMNTDKAEASTLPDDGGASTLPLDRLDSLELGLRFEVGDLSLTLGELKRIQAGHVFELEQPLNRSLVRILAHGNVLGKGYLVAVGDRLGVRVADFTPAVLG